MRQLGAFLLLIGSLGISHEAFSKSRCDAESGYFISGIVNAPWTIQLQFIPEDIPLNAPFEAIVNFCSQPGLSPTRVSIDATMPAHKHGMNYKPRMEQIDSHHFEVKNLLFHMPGVWRLEVTAYDNEKPYRFTHDLKLP